MYLQKLRIGYNKFYCITLAEIHQVIIQLKTKIQVFFNDCKEIKLALSDHLFSLYNNLWSFNLFRGFERHYWIVLGSHWCRMLRIKHQRISKDSLRNVTLQWPYYRGFWYIVKSYTVPAKVVCTFYCCIMLSFLMFCCNLFNYLFIHLFIHYHFFYYALWCIVIDTFCRFSWWILYCFVGHIVIFHITILLLLSIILLWLLYLCSIVCKL